MDKPLKKSLFGYKKSNVNTYIQKMNEAAKRMLEKKNAEIKALREECEQLKAQKDSIADALLSARERAHEIVENSEQEAERTRDKLKADYSRELENIDKIRGWIAEIRKSTAQTLSYFDEVLKTDETAALQKRRAATPLEDGLLKGEEVSSFVNSDTQSASEAARENETQENPEIQENSENQEIHQIKKPTIIKLK